VCFGGVAVVCVFGWFSSFRRFGMWGGGCRVLVLLRPFPPALGDVLCAVSGRLPAWEFVGPEASK
jgi:hypothetical protein